MTPTDAVSGRPANRLGLDYTTEAARLGPPPVPIIDVHAHINGRAAATLYRRVMEQFGVGLVYSMTRLEELERVRERLEDRIRFIAVPDYWATENRRYHHGVGYIPRIKAYHALGTRIVKFWAAPRGTDYATEMGDPTFMRLDAPHRVEAMEAAQDLGMMFMTHVADPDTWFQTRYTDASVYGTKEDQYEPLERLLDRFTVPWIAAHMGGWPEDLGFLTGLLERHDNLFLDTSATKWMVRELSRHAPAERLGFFDRFRGRLLFGSDIVTTDEHLTDDAGTEKDQHTQASTAQEAFDLYASRYLALRTLFETDYDGPSPIADPDLEMVDAKRFGPMDAPTLKGCALPRETLSALYHSAAATLLEPFHT